MSDGYTPVALYIHWPFCQSKCPYCDFNSHVRDHIDLVRWRSALLQELGAVHEKAPSHRLVSVFFGGGTPSLCPPDLVGALIDKACGLWSCDEDLEVTLEANPGSSEAQRFKDYAKAGVNRLSLGVQSFDDDALGWLGRLHDSKQARAAIGYAAEAVARVSIDLIYARDGQTLDGWDRELDEALQFGLGHYSLYQLTFEPGTAFSTALRKGQMRAMENDLAALFYQATMERMGRAQRTAYEISNFAASGDECRHNLVYWRGGDYLGIGPGAASRLGQGGKRQAWRRPALPEKWLRAVEDGAAWDASEWLSARQIACEMMMTGLRMAEGVDGARLKQVSGLDLRDVLDTQALAWAVRAGWLLDHENRLVATEAGLLRLDGLLPNLIR